jgi:hypothetical protein
MLKDHNWRNKNTRMLRINVKQQLRVAKFPVPQYETHCFGDGRKDYDNSKVKFVPVVN